MLHASLPVDLADLALALEGHGSTGRVLSGSNKVTLTIQTEGRDRLSLLELQLLERVYGLLCTFCASAPCDNDLAVGDVVEDARGGAYTLCGHEAGMLVFVEGFGKPFPMQRGERPRVLRLTEAQARFTFQSCLCHVEKVKACRRYAGLESA